MPRSRRDSWMHIHTSRWITPAITMCADCRSSTSTSPSRLSLPRRTRAPPSKQDSPLYATLEAALSAAASSLMLLCATQSTKESWSVRACWLRRRGSALLAATSIRPADFVISFSGVNRITQMELLIARMRREKRCDSKSRMAPT